MFNAFNEHAAASRPVQFPSLTRLYVDAQLRSDQSGHLSATGITDVVLTPTKGPRCN